MAVDPRPSAWARGDPGVETGACGGSGSHGAQGPFCSVRRAGVGGSGSASPPATRGRSGVALHAGAPWPRVLSSARESCCLIPSTRPQPGNGHAGRSACPTPRLAGLLMRQRKPLRGLLWLRHEGQLDGDFVPQPLLGPRPPASPIVPCTIMGATSQGHDAIRGGSPAGTPSVGARAWWSCLTDLLAQGQAPPPSQATSFKPTARWAPTGVPKTLPRPSEGGWSLSSQVFPSHRRRLPRPTPRRKHGCRLPQQRHRPQLSSPLPVRSGL